MTNKLVSTKMFAKIKGHRYPVEVLGYRYDNGYVIARVRVLPRSDGFQPKPFTSCTWSAPFVHDAEGEVLQSQLEVQS